MNVHQNGEKAPPFALTKLDEELLASRDEDFIPHSWEDVKQIIVENRLEDFRRWPSDLRRYMQWASDTKAVYGTIPNFVMRERLHWQPLPLSTAHTGPLFELMDAVPFSNPADYKILQNDWPYGLEKSITHIIVWLKDRLETEPTKGDMTPKSRRQVENFVQRTFLDRVSTLPGTHNKVIWFKNWRALQSVPGLEHVHVLVRDVPYDIILEWTGRQKEKQG